MSAQTACQSPNVEAVFFHSCHARKCCAAVAATSEDLLCDERGPVGFRVQYLVQLNIGRVSKQHMSATGIATTGHSY